MDTPDVYAACDIIVIASLRTEASPIVLREAFASGRPVIATKVGDIPEIMASTELVCSSNRRRQSSCSCDTGIHSDPKLACALRGERFALCSRTFSFDE